jgi:hypothetical protein
MKNVVKFPGRNTRPPPPPPEPESNLDNELRKVELQIAEVHLAQFKAQMRQLNAMWFWYCFKRLLFWGALFWLVMHMSAAKADPWTTRSYYDGRGSFAGSSSTHDNRSSFYDSSGRFSGSAIRYGNRTNFYGPRGNLTGTSIGRGAEPALGPRR